MTPPFPPDISDVSEQMIDGIDTQAETSPIVIEPELVEEGQVPTTFYPPNPFEAHESFAPREISEEELLSQVLNESPSVPEEQEIDENASAWERFLHAIVGFEQRHPWLFFFLIAMVLFVIVVAILSFFSGSTDTTKPSNNTPANKAIIENEGRSVTQKGYDAVKIGQYFALSDRAFDQLVYTGSTDTFLSPYFIQAQRLNEIMNIDIQKKIAESQDPEKTFTDYRNTLAIEITKSQTNFNNLENIITELENERTSLKTQASDYQSRLKTGFEQGGFNEVTYVTKLYHDTLDKLAKVDNKITIAETVYGGLKKRLPTATARLDAMDKNKKALIEAIIFEQIRNSGIDFEREDLKNDQGTLNGFQQSGVSGSFDMPNFSLPGMTGSAGASGSGEIPNPDNSNTSGAPGASGTSSYDILKSRIQNFAPSGGTNTPQNTPTPSNSVPNTSGQTNNLQSGSGNTWNISGSIDANINPGNLAFGLPGFQKSPLGGVGNTSKNPQNTNQSGASNQPNTSLGNYIPNSIGNVLNNPSSVPSYRGSGIAPNSNRGNTIPNKKDLNSGINNAANTPQNQQNTNNSPSSNTEWKQKKYNDGGKNINIKTSFNPLAPSRVNKILDMIP